MSDTITVTLTEEQRDWLLSQALVLRNSMNLTLALDGCGCSMAARLRDEIETLDGVRDALRGNPMDSVTHKAVERHLESLGFELASDVPAIKHGGPPLEYGYRIPGNPYTVRVPQNPAHYLYRHDLRFSIERIAEHSGVSVDEVARAIVDGGGE